MRSEGLAVPSPERHPLAELHGPPGVEPRHARRVELDGAVAGLGLGRPLVGTAGHPDPAALDPHRAGVPVEDAPSEAEQLALRIPVVMARS
jgi:hypothetical protein